MGTPEEPLPESIQLAAAVVLGGIEIWANPPRLGNQRVTVDTVAVVPAMPPDQEASSWEGGVDPSRPGVILLTRDPIKLFTFTAEDPPLYGGTTPFRIAVNRRTGYIEWGYTDTSPFARKHRGSAAIGIFLFSLPITLPLALPLLAYNGYYSRKERTWGMSRHAHAILEAVRAQLSPEDYGELQDAFRKTWAHEQKMAVKVTFHEAQRRLQRLERLSRATHPYGDPRLAETFYEWHDAEGQVLATGHLYPEEHRQIQVFGSEFRDNEARVLIECYASTREMSEA